MLRTPGLVLFFLFLSVGSRILVQISGFETEAHFVAPPAEFVFESPNGLSPAYQIAAPIERHSSLLSVYHHHQKPVLREQDLSYPAPYFQVSFARVYRQTVLN